MWNRFAGIAVLLFVLALARDGASAEPAGAGLPPVSKEEVLKAIDLFQRDPTKLARTGTRLTIMRFAQDSTDIRVEIGPKPVPWLENKSVKDDVRANLLTAYLAGNVKSQLEHGAAKNDSVAGCAQVVATYKQLQKSEPGLVVPEVEKLVELQKQGKLAEYLGEGEAEAEISVDTATSVKK